MLLTLSTTHTPATDLGYLLHKHPGRAQAFRLPFGEAHVFYPEASETRCAAALVLDIDPVRLTRRGGAPSFALQPYVNDRPYATSSFMSVALARVFKSALQGQCREKPALADTPLPLQATLSALPCRSRGDEGGEALLKRLFEPLGYAVQAERYPLDPAFPAWGDSDYFSVTLSGTLTLSALLRHLYVLTPVLDDAKHYWVDQDEVEKLLARGAGWLEQHPERALIARRYLKHQRGLASSALAALASFVDEPEPTTKIDGASTLRLHDERLAWVHQKLKESGARRVLDLGCGEGKLLKRLVHDPQFTHLAGMDVSTRSLAKAAARLEPSHAKDRVDLFQGSLLYRDSRLAGFDAAALVEVIEHLEPFQLGALEQSVFAHARPQTVILTTPNRDYNARFGTGEALRHPDHRFEWTRAEFRAWAQGVAKRYGYALELSAISTDLLPEDPDLGAPTQVGVFKLKTKEDEKKMQEVLR